MTRLKRDDNFVPISGGVSSADADVTLPLQIDPVTGRLLVSTSGSSTPSVVYNGQKVVTTAGTAVPLSTTTAITSVVVKALYSNTGTIYVGSSSVSSSNGIELQAGDSVSIEIDDLATVYIDASVNGEGVSYLAS